MADEVSNWVEKKLSENPVLTIVVIASIGVAFLTGVGVLRPVFNAGQWVRSRFMPVSSRPQPQQGGSGVTPDSGRTGRRGGQ